MKIHFSFGSKITLPSPMFLSIPHGYTASVGAGQTALGERGEVSAACKRRPRLFIVGVRLNDEPSSYGQGVLERGRHAVSRSSTGVLRLKQAS